MDVQLLPECKFLSVWSLSIWSVWRMTVFAANKMIVEKQARAKGKYNRHCGKNAASDFMNNHNTGDGLK